MSGAFPKKAGPERQRAEAGLAKMESWMKEIGVVMNITELGVTEEMIPKLVKATLILDGGYKKLDPNEIAQIPAQTKLLHGGRAQIQNGLKG